MKYKVGDSVIIIANNNCHKFDIGDEVEILKVDNSANDYLAWDGSCCVWWVNENEIELIEPAE